MCLTANFHWEGMREDVKDFLSTCYVCQTTKYSTEKSFGLLQLTELPNQVREDIALDFIVGLPRSKGFTVILVVVDRLTKHDHSGPLPTSHTASQVPELCTSLVILVVVVDILSKYHHFGPLPTSENASQVPKLFTSGYSLARCATFHYF